MHDIDKLSSKLVRILNVETCEHPTLRQAIMDSRSDIEEIVWESVDFPDTASVEQLANAIEDRVGYNGYPMPLALREGWRKTVRYALAKAGEECGREAGYLTAAG